MELEAHLLKRLLDTAGRQARDDLRSLLTTTTACESPIELVMFAALYSHLRYFTGCWFLSCSADDFQCEHATWSIGSPRIPLRRA
jgi:hypothetical protein